MSFPAKSAWSTTGAPLATSDGMARTQGGWNDMPVEARYAAQPTLEEKAWFARLATAAIDGHVLLDARDWNSYFA